MATGSEPAHPSPVNTAPGKAPVPIFSQPYREEIVCYKPWGSPFLKAFRLVECRRNADLGQERKRPRNKGDAVDFKDFRENKPFGPRKRSLHVGYASA